MKKIDLLSKKAFIFDVDGTLYSNKKMHFFMALKMIKSIIKNPKSIKEIICVYYFRKYRERRKFKNYDIESVCREVSRKLKIDILYVQKSINKWMFIVPLECISRCRYTQIIEYIKKIKKDNKLIILYSDYHIYDKAKMLKINYDRTFVPGEEIVNELKPSKEIMKAIIKFINDKGYVDNEVLYIGDDTRKDGESAKLVSIDYLYIKRFKRLVKRKHRLYAE